jgi:hypothetical protein
MTEENIPVFYTYAQCKLIKILINIPRDNPFIWSFPDLFLSLEGFLRLSKKYI